MSTSELNQKLNYSTIVRNSIILSLSSTGLSSAVLRDELDAGGLEGSADGLSRGKKSLRDIPLMAVLQPFDLVTWDGGRASWRQNPFDGISDTAFPRRYNTVADRGSRRPGYGSGRRRGLWQRSQRVVEGVRWEPL
jgi:hypothetical protein